MTRTEFNKLTQQERLNLVGEKWFGLYKNNKEYGWSIERTYTKDKDEERKILSERSWLNIQPPFEKYFNGLEVWLATDKSGDYHICYKNGGITFSIGTIPDGFLEEGYFMEIPKSCINEIIDESTLDEFVPFIKQYKDYRSVEEICKTKINIEQKTINNAKTITKINIAIIGIAILITIINIITCIC